MPYLLIEIQHRLSDYNAILLHDDFCFLLLPSGILGMDDVDTWSEGKRYRCITTGILICRSAVEQCGAHKCESLAGGYRHSAVAYAHHDTLLHGSLVIDTHRS